MSLSVRPPGQPLAVLLKRAADARYYLIDCANLLNEFELLAKVESVEGTALDLEKSKIGPNNTVKVFINAEPYSGTAPFTDTNASVVCVTSQGTVQASFTLRVYKH